MPKAGKQKDAYPGPHGIQFPHMPEIAEVGVSEGLVAERGEHLARPERRRLATIGAEADEESNAGSSKSTCRSSQNGDLPIDTGQCIE